MRKNFGAKTWLYPMPVLIVGTYDENGAPNAMNAAWGGVYDTDQVMICLADDHKTTENIKRTGAFTVSFATAKTVVPCDYVGIVSANDVPDKLLDPIIYDGVTHAYWRFGEKVGQAFSDGKKLR